MFSARGLVSPQAITAMNSVNLTVSVSPETYWGLVRLGAEIQTPVDEYVSNLLLHHVEECETDQESELNSDPFKDQS